MKTPEHTELSRKAEKVYYGALYANVVAWEIRERLAWLAVGKWIHGLLTEPEKKPVKSEKVAVRHMCENEGSCCGCGGPTRLVFSVGEVRLRACNKQCAVKAIKERM